MGMAFFISCRTTSLIRDDELHVPGGATGTFPVPYQRKLYIPDCKNNTFVLCIPIFQQQFEDQRPCHIQGLLPFYLLQILEFSITGFNA